MSTPTTIKQDDLIASIADAFQFISYYHPLDYIQALGAAYEREQSPAARDAIAQILTNSRMSAEGHRPICQDTGIATVFLKVGMDVRWDATMSLADMVNEGVRRAYNNKDNLLRASVLSDPAFTRKNTKDNTPAVIHYEIVPGHEVEVICAAKGGGSEAKSKLVMLNPSDSIVDWVVKTVPTMGAGWCPPGLLGIGIGGTPEKAMLLAKESLMAPVDMAELLARGPKNKLEELRIELYNKVNALGIGAQGLGGDHVAEADAGRQHLGEGSHIDGALRRQRTDRGRRVARIGQFAVRVVLKDQQVEFASLLGETVAALLGQQPPGRVLEVRQAIQKLGPAQRFAHRFRHDTVFIGSNRYVLRLEQREGLQRTEIGRRFHQHGIARIDQHLGQQIQPLLRTGNHQHLIGMHRRFGRAVARGDPFTQRGKTFRSAVLQRFTAAGGQHALQRRQRFLDGKGFRSRQAAGKRNHFRPLGHLEDFTDGGTLDRARPSGKKLVEIRRNDRSGDIFHQGIGFHGS